MTPVRTAHWKHTPLLLVTPLAMDKIYALATHSRYALHWEVVDDRIYLGQTFNPPWRAEQHMRRALASKRGLAHIRDWLCPEPDSDRWWFDCRSG